MNTLEIKKEDALKAHENASSKGKTLLENLLGKKTFQKKVTDRIKTIKDVLEYNGISEEERSEKYMLFFDNLKLPHLYYQWLAELLCKSLNEDWTPDWDNSNERKYFPWFKMCSGGFRYDDFAYWLTGSSVGSRLCLKSDELAKYAGTQFTEVYEQFMITK